MEQARLSQDQNSQPRPQVYFPNLGLTDLLSTLNSLQEGPGPVFSFLQVKTETYYKTEFMYHYVASPVECFAYEASVVVVAQFDCRRFDWRISSSQTAPRLSRLFLLSLSCMSMWSGWQPLIKLHGVGAADWIIGQVLAGSFTFSHCNNVNKCIRQCMPWSCLEVKSGVPYVWAWDLGGVQTGLKIHTNTTTLLFLCDLTCSPGCLIYIVNTSCRLQLLHLEMIRGLGWNMEHF